MTAADFVSQLGAAGRPRPTSTGWQARCPAHEDGNASLSITQRDDKVLIHCHANCTTEAVVTAAGLKMTDLFTPKTATNGHAQKSRIAETYDYADESGVLLYQAVRLDPKEFRQRRPDGSGWIWSIAGVRPVPYRLPELIDAAAAGRPVFVVEGEKDADAMRDAGLTATCNSGGAGKWKREFAEQFNGATVCVIADKDDAGRKHAQQVAANLQPVASHVVVIELPDIGGTKVKDAADYLSAGGLAAGIVTLAEDAPSWTPQAPTVENVTTANTAGAATVAAEHFRSDIGYADAFVRRHGQEIRFCAEEERWLVFDRENGWRRDGSNRIKSMFANYARELYRDALEQAKDMDPAIGKRLIDAMAGLGNKKRIEPALSFAACNPSVVIRATQLDADPFLVGVLNGVVDLQSGSFQPHRPEHLVTRRLEVHYDANATAPTWDRFLDEVQPDPKMRAFLQRLSGYSITGAIREHVLPFHYGVGANGKGTFLEHAMLKLLGDYGAKLTNGLVYANDRAKCPLLELAELCGRRFGLGEENNDGARLNEGALKSITGGDRQKGRFHYKEHVEYFPSYKIALVGNHKPRIDGTDDGIWRRFLLVDWPVQIPSDKRDGKLPDKLAVEMSGILNWCIAGARAWMAEGLNPPESCRAATEAFRDGSDSLAEFIEDAFEKDHDGYCTKADAFNAYKQWAGRQGISRPMSKRCLGAQFVNRRWQEFKRGDGNSKCWAGYRLKNQFGE